MKNTRYQIPLDAQQELRKLFYSKESFISIIKNITVFYTNYGEFFSINSKAVWLFIKTTLILLS
jgi:hypothetical protein